VICPAALNQPSSRNVSVTRCQLEQGHDEPHRNEHEYSDAWWPVYGRAGRRFKGEWWENKAPKGEE
jgi:hypothetical protein